MGDASAADSGTKPPTAARRGGHGAKPAPGSTNEKADASDARATAQRQQQLQSEQHELQDRLARMKKNLADAEAAHSEATDALAASESAISAVNRRLRELAVERGNVERQLGDVRQRQRAAASRQGEQERVAGDLLQRLVADSAPESTTGWLDVASVALPIDAGDALGRDGVIGLTGYLVADRARTIDALRDRRVELASLEDEARSRQDDLSRISGDERHNQKQLVREQDSRRQTLASLSKQINRQRSTVASLERDDKRMSNLIQQLATVLAAPPKRVPSKAAPGPGNAAPVQPAFEPPAGAGLAQQRGHLRLPVAGEAIGRFGTARPAEDGEAQPGAPSWKGVFLRAPTGTEVHVIAAGRVVFADWLRGFGNLMIVDHGEGFISVYGNNETLLRSVGDRIAGDEVIATVGNTGGNVESGLYFELRYEGRPFDPLAWATAR